MCQCDIFTRLERTDVITKQDSLKLSELLDRHAPVGVLKFRQSTKINPIAVHSRTIKSKKYLPKAECPSWNSC